MGARVVGGGIGALLAIAAGFGCGGSDATTERGDEGGVAPFCDLEGAVACRSDDACAAGEICSESCCLPACDTEGDCERAACGPLGCVCDAGACRDRLCSANGECPQGSVCAAGRCVDPPAEEDIASCAIAPRWGAIRAGMEIALRVQAYDESGHPLPPSDRFRFASSAPDRVQVDDAGVARGGSGVGAAIVAATAGDARCEAELWSHGPLPEGALRAVVVDELTGLPIEGAMVQIEAGATPLAATTDASGAVTFALDALPPPPRTISVFHDEFAWITVAGTGAEDLLLPIRRVLQADRAGGLRGVFGPDALFHPDFVHAGIAGTSIPGNVIDLSFRILVGPSRRTRVTIGEARDVDLPSGVVLGMGNTWFKQEYQALGVAGVCDDREAAAAGTCGTRTAWGIAGDVPLLDLPIDEITEEADLEAGELLARLLPHFQRFRSAVVRDVRFDLHPRIDGAPDWERFVRRDLRAGQRMALQSTVRLPELPKANGAWMDGAIVFGGADTPDRGLVPLGITAGVDADPTAGSARDGRIDDSAGRSSGELSLRIAPLHGGLEGSGYVVLALAANFADMAEGTGACTAEDRGGCAAVSGLVHHSDDFPFGGAIDFGGAPFVGPAEAASWIADERRFSLGALPHGAPNVLRLQLSAGGRSWQVWMPARTGDLVLPLPPGADDRAAGSSASVQALRLAVDLDGLVAFDDRHLGDLVQQLSGFSTLDLP